MGKTKKLVVSAILLAWILVLGMTQLGLIPVGPVRATTLHIPALIAAILFDKYMGMFLGLSFGLYSWYQNFRAPTVLSFVFQNPVVSVLPRVIFPIIAYYLYQYLKDKTHRQIQIFGSVLFTALSAELIYSLYKAYVSENKSGFIVGAILLLFVIAVWIYSLRNKTVMAPGFMAAAIATICHTIMVMGLIYIIYLPKYMEAMNMTRTLATNAILTTVVVNGVPEAVIGGLVVAALLKRKESYDFNR